ncbi:hypothetical protein FACS1894214_4570 [Planctomycetales bacterium]|nr:hypothetical protein FACS1894214_4570 [Planctomycetales bacterium]
MKNVKIEVLDYLAGSALQPCPPLDLNVLWKKPLRSETDLGEIREIQRKWERVKLKIPAQERASRIGVSGTRGETAGGEQICFSLASLPFETTGFQKSVSSADISSLNASWGAVVLFYNNKNYVVPVDELLAALSVQDSKDRKKEPRYVLQGTGLEIGDVSFRPRGLLLRFALYSAEGKKEYMTLAPDAGEVNIQATVFGVFGTYIVDLDKTALHKDEIQPEVLQRLSKPRLEIMQGTDKRLNYRYWNGRKYAVAGQFSVSEYFNPDGNIADGTKISGKQSIALETGTPDEVQVITEQFVPQDYPGLRIVPRPVGQASGAEHRVKLCVTVDGSEDIFWLRPSQVPPERDQVRYVQGNGRAVRITWDYDKVNLGFGVFLKKFEKRTEPGTRTASHYSSLADFVEVPKDGLSPENRKEPENLPVLQKDVLIKMNQPAVFRGNGRKYSIYQSAFDGPFHPGDYYFHNLYDGKILPWEERPRESLYVSKLSVNDDPGRGLKYLGSFLLIFGTVWLFTRKEK